MIFVIIEKQFPLLFYIYRFFYYSNQTMESSKESSFNSDYGASEMNTSYTCDDLNAISLNKINMSSYLFFSSNLNSMTKRHHHQQQQQKQFQNESAFPPSDLNLAFADPLNINQQRQSSNPSANFTGKNLTEIIQNHQNNEQLCYHKNNKTQFILNNINQLAVNNNKFSRQGKYFLIIIIKLSSVKF